ncbi:CHAT domain-containing protein [Ephemerocybe angulata]|uniref:CHAT domain-containing protein n=1 Tax=Ephemerocybe angulata TaxID=980116 RepID=A0A8H6H978_9AGAR|nr:CHAT domain-containing protein [Tulosesus angulatus]
MYLENITVECAQDDIHLLTPFQEEKLILMIHILGGREWAEVVLRRTAATTWTCHDRSIRLFGGTPNLWVVLLAESCNGIGHICQYWRELRELEEKVHLGAHAVTKVFDIERSESARFTFEANLQSSSSIQVALADSLESLDGAANYFYRRYTRDGGRGLIENAIEAWEAILDRDDSETTPILRFLALALLDRFMEDEDSDPQDIKRAVSLMQEVRSRTPTTHALHAFVLEDLGRCLAEYAIHTDNWRDLDICISVQRDALKATPTDDSLRRAKRLFNLASSLIRRSIEFRTNLAHIQEGLKLAKESLDLTPADSRELPRRMGLISSALEMRFRFSGDLEDINEAIAQLQMAYKLIPTEDLMERIKVLSRLGTLFLARYEATNRLSDVRFSIATISEAIELTPTNDPQLPQLLTSLGASLTKSFYRTDDLSEIQTSISVLEQAISLTPQSHPMLPTRHDLLGSALEYSFNVSRELGDIQASISSHRKSIQLTPAGHLMLGRRLSGLARALIMRSKVTGEVVDIQEVIVALENRIKELSEGHEELPNLLYELGSVIMRRFHELHLPEDLEKGVDAFERAIKLAPRGLSQIADWYNDLGEAYVWRSELSQNAQYQVAAVEAKRKAVQMTPTTHGVRPVFLNSFGMCLGRLFDFTGDIALIEEAIASQREAVTLVDEGHAGLPTWYSRLAESFDRKFSQTMVEADIREAIAAQTKACNLVPEGNFDFPSYRRALGEIYLKLYKHTHDQGVLCQAIAVFKSAAMSPVGLASERIRASQRWGTYSRSFDFQSTLDSFDRTIDLLGVFIGLEQSQSRRQSNIQHISGVALSAFAAACEGGQVEKGLEWLERGRCLVWSQLNNLRTPLDDLRAVDEALADRVLEISKALDASGAQSELTNIDLENIMSDAPISTKPDREHTDLTVEWNRLVASVRTKPGFEHFLQATPVSTLLQNIPTHGTVVIINMHATRCDALALQSRRDPKLIPLAGFSMAKAKSMSVQVREQLGMRGVKVRGYEDERPSGEGDGRDGPSEEDGSWEDESGHGPGDGNGSDVEVEDSGFRATRVARRKKAGITQMLRELWTLVVRPIFNALGLTDKSAPRERIWWLPTGPLVFLPLHAAGDYQTGTGVASDFAVSSYIPNISILTSRTTASHTSYHNNVGIFMVSQPKTPGQSPLPGTTQEVKAIQPVFDMHQLRNAWIEGEEATTKVAMENMAQYSCIHMACHAVQDDEEPLSSGFFLQDGRLKLSTIIKNNLKTADLAFLSACQTSKGDEKLSEEAVHLAAGMLAAGYRGVVGTMWSIRDQYAPIIAQNFYKELFNLTEMNGGAGVNGVYAAAALDFAVQQLRAELGDSEDALLTWVPYVHFGL